MEKVTVQRDELLERLKLNLSTHKDDLETALKARHQESIAILEKLLQHHKADDNFIMSEVIQTPLPASHVSDYERVIKMVEMSVDTNIELKSFEFDQYICDNWSWKHEFISKSLPYGINFK